MGPIGSAGSETRLRTVRARCPAPPEGGTPNGLPRVEANPFWELVYQRMDSFRKGWRTHPHLVPPVGSSVFRGSAFAALRHLKVELRTGCHAWRPIHASNVPTVLSFHFRRAEGFGIMQRATYLWRQLTPQQRARWLAWRQRNRRPWHAPPHRIGSCRTEYHITAACYEHQPHIGLNSDRLGEFCTELFSLTDQNGILVSAWCVLPNHYHILLEVADGKALLLELGQLHGRLSCEWNRRESAPGRKVFHACVEREIRSDRHHWATLNYIHHNPVHHRYTDRWMDWPWSSAGAFLEQVGRKNALRIWREYPVMEYGKGWDAPEI